MDGAAGVGELSFLNAVEGITSPAGSENFDPNVIEPAPRLFDGQGPQIGDPKTRGGFGHDGVGEDKDAREERRARKAHQKPRSQRKSAAQEACLGQLTSGARGARRCGGDGELLTIGHRRGPDRVRGKGSKKAKGQG